MHKDTSIKQNISIKLVYHFITEASQSFFSLFGDILDCLYEEFEMNA